MIILYHFPEVSKYWILVAPLYWLIGEPDKKRSCPIKLNYPGQQSQPSALSFVILIFWSHLDSLCSSDTSPAPGYTRQGLLLWSPTTDFFLLTPLWGIYSCWPVVWLLGKTKTLSGLSGCHRVNAPQTSTAFLLSPASDQVWFFSLTPQCSVRGDQFVNTFCLSDAKLSWRRLSLCFLLEMNKPVLIQEFLLLIWGYIFVISLWFISCLDWKFFIE